MAKSLKRGIFSKSLLLGFISCLVLGLAWPQTSPGGYADRTISAVFTPGYHAARFVAQFLFTDYMVPHTTGWYLLPLLGAAGNLICLTAFFYLCLRLKRTFQPEEPEPLPSDYESIQARRKHRGEHFNGEEEPDYAPNAGSTGSGRLDGLLDLINRERFKVRVWQEFRDHTGNWPLLSIFFHYSMLVGGIVGTVLFLWLKDHKQWGEGLSIGVGISLGVVYLLVFFVGEKWVRKFDWRLFGKTSRNA